MAFIRQITKRITDQIQETPFRQLKKPSSIKYLFSFFKKIPPKTPTKTWRPTDFQPQLKITKGRS